MADRKRNVSVIILAGGKSTRMGEDKAFIELRGRAIIEHILAVFLALSDDIVIVTNNPEQYRCLGQRIVSDLLPQSGSLVGLYSGLHAIAYQHAFAVACDMPFISVPLVNYMIKQIDDYDAVIPSYDDYYEALHAIYSCACIPVIEAQLTRGDYKITNFFDQIRARYINKTEIARFASGHWSFFNVNNPSDLERAGAYIERNGGSS